MNIRYPIYEGVYRILTVQALSQGQLCLDFKQHLHHTPRVGRAYPDEYRKRNQLFPPYGEDIPQLD